MSTVSQVAKAFADGKSANCGNAKTDGASYYLHGNKIASKIASKTADGRVQLNWCGWYTPTMANHLNNIRNALGCTGPGSRVGYASARDAGVTTFYAF